MSASIMISFCPKDKEGEAFACHLEEGQLPEWLIKRSASALFSPASLTIQELALGTHKSLSAAYATYVKSPLVASLSHFCLDNRQAHWLITSHDAASFGCLPKEVPA